MRNRIVVMYPIRSVPKLQKDWPSSSISWSPRQEGCAVSTNRGTGTVSLEQIASDPIPRHVSSTAVPGVRYSTAAAGVAVPSVRPSSGGGCLRVPPDHRKSVEE